MAAPEPQATFSPIAPREASRDRVLWCGNECERSANSPAERRQKTATRRHSAWPGRAEATVAGAGTKAAAAGAGTEAATAGAGTKAAAAGAGTEAATAGAGTEAATTGTGTEAAAAGAGT